MNAFFEKMERGVDRAIPYVILFLLAIVIIDVFFHETSQKYHSQIVILDAIIITFFVIDLSFKYNRVRNIPRFLKLYWLDVLAIFPFFLLLRVFEEFLLVSERSALTLRNLFHAGLVLEEEALLGERAAQAARTSEILAKEGRVAVLTERLSFLRRTPRLLRAVSFYEHPEQETTLYHIRK